jgi:integrase
MITEVSPPSKARRRERPGEGGVYPYDTNEGELWLYSCWLTLPDGTKKRKVKRGFKTEEEARDEKREAQVASKKRTWTEPSKQRFGQYLDTHADGLRLAPSTVASYRRNVRVHIKDYPIANVPLGSLTPAMLTAHYRRLEATGLRGSKGERTGRPMSARSVRYLHSILHSALKAAVPAQIPSNPAALASPPTAKQARAPEMHCWTAEDLGQFLAWSAGHSVFHVLWTVLATTGMRRGEVLGLRWRDVDLDRGRITVRRSAVPVRVHGEHGMITEGPPKSGKPRVVAIDPATVAALKAWKRDRGLIQLTFAQPDAIVFGNLEGKHVGPERVTRNFGEAVDRCRKEHPELPVITLHGLRHTHVSVLLSSGVPVKTVSARVGHSTPLVTMSVYAHLLEGDDEAAAGMFASLVSAPQVSAEYHGSSAGNAQQAGEGR